MVFFLSLNQSSHLPQIHKEKSGMFTAQPPSAAAKKQSPGPRKKQRAATANINHVSSNVEKRENPLSLNSHRPRSAPKSSSMRLTPPKMDWDGVPLKGDATRGGSTSSRYRAPVSSRNRELSELCISVQLLETCTTCSLMFWGFEVFTSINACMSAFGWCPDFYVSNSACLW